MSDTLEQARAHVADLEAEEAEKVYRRKVADLAAIRLERRAKQARYEELRALDAAQKEAYRIAESEVTLSASLIAQHDEHRPSVIDFLPGDPECMAWQQRADILEQQHREAVERRNALPSPYGNPVIEELSALQGPYGVLSTLAYAESNLEQELRGKGSAMRNRIEGGVFAVK